MTMISVSIPRCIDSSYFTIPSSIRLPNFFHYSLLVLLKQPLELEPYQTHAQPSILWTILTPTYTTAIQPNPTQPTDHPLPLISTASASLLLIGRQGRSDWPIIRPGHDVFLLKPASGLPGPMRHSWGQMPRVQNVQLPQSIQPALSISPHAAAQPAIRPADYVIRG